MKTRVCKVFHFDAAHRLPNYEGRCAALHGHRWTLEVEVSSDRPIQSGSEAGMVVDFAKLKKEVNESIIDRLDHSYLNDVVENPTCENLLELIWNVLRGEIEKSPGSLERLRLYETPDSFAEMRRND